MCVYEFPWEEKNELCLFEPTGGVGSEMADRYKIGVKVLELSATKEVGSQWGTGRTGEGERSGEVSWGQVTRVWSFSFQTPPTASPALKTGSTWVWATPAACLCGVSVGWSGPRNGWRTDRRSSLFRWSACLQRLIWSAPLITWVGISLTKRIALSYWLSLFPSEPTNDLVCRCCQDLCILQWKHLPAQRHQQCREYFVSVLVMFKYHQYFFIFFTLHQKKSLNLLKSISLIRTTSTGGKSAWPLNCLRQETTPLR